MLHHRFKGGLKNKQPFYLKIFGTRHYELKSMTKPAIFGRLASMGLGVFIFRSGATPTIYSTLHRTRNELRNRYTAEKDSRYIFSLLLNHSVTRQTQSGAHERRDDLAGGVCEVTRLNGS
jgi:hypothetical protein